MDGAALGQGASPLPFPSLVGRELYRVDRSTPWREAALVGAIGAAAEMVMGDLHAAHAAVTVLVDTLSERRTTSWAATTAVLLAGLEATTPTRLARALGCTRPGAIQVLGALAQAGLLAPGSDLRQARWRPTD